MSRKVIIVTVIVIILVAVISYFYFSRSSTRETGPDIPCTSDDDCWCRSFTGAGFIEGKSPGKCCVEGAKVLVEVCPEVNHCMKCYYK